LSPRVGHPGAVPLPASPFGQFKALFDPRPQATLTRVTGLRRQIRQDQPSLVNTGLATHGFPPWPCGFLSPPQDAIQKEAMSFFHKPTLVSLWRGGCDVGCTCHQSGTGRLARCATSCPPRRRGACHLPSQGEQCRAEPLVRCNLLKIKPEEQTRPAGIDFAFSWSGNRTKVAPRRLPGRIMRTEVCCAVAATPWHA
jgi:hypothetical protein